MLRNKFYDSLKRILFAFVATMFIAPVFSATLPAGYTQLEYLESDGSQYIDTGLALQTATDDIELIYQANETTSGNSLFGARASTSGSVYTFAISSSLKYRVGWNSSTPTLELDADTNKHTLKIEHNGGVFKLDGTTIATQGNANITTPTTATLFAIHATSSTTIYYGTVKIYEYKMWRNGTLTQHMIPAKYVSGNTTTYGMYDLMDSNSATAFHTNKGTGSFTAGPIIQSCPNFYDKDTMTVKNITLVRLPEIETGNGSATVIVPIKSNQKYTVAIIGGSSIALWRAGTAPDGTPPTTATSYQKLTSYQPITLTSGAFDKYLYIQFSSTYASQVLSNLMVVEGEVAPTTYAEYDASICTPNTIKIATTKYNEDAFADLITTLNSAITKVTNIVDTTVAQASSIGTLATTKQDRPADGDCPAGRKCLLVTGTDGKPHWYLIQE